MGRHIERKRELIRENNKIADIAEGARRRAAGIGDGLFAANRNTHPEPEPEKPDPEVEAHEGRRGELMGYGLLSRTPAPPRSGRSE